MHHSDSATVTTVDTLAKLLDVCGELRASEQVDERAVTGCSFDSRAVSAGDVFFCKGAAFKPAFLSMALDAGAVAFVCEESLVESLEPLAKESGAAMLVVDSVRTAMALLPPGGLRPSRPRRQDRGHHRHQGKDHGRFYAPVHHQSGGRVLRHDRLGEYRRWYRVLREHQHHARGPRGLAPYRQLPHVRSPVHGHGGLEPGAQVPTRRESAV